jgi:cytochrome c553
MNARAATIRAAAILLLTATAARLPAADESGVEFFETRVRPILVERCYSCHGAAAKSKGGLRLDSRAAAVEGGDTGPAVVPGKPNESLLVDAINYGELYQMPPKGRLPAEEIATLTKWIELGAPWPAGAATAPAASSDGGFDLAKRRAEHWCWQPVRSVLPPAVKNANWPREPLDRFILAKLEARGLAPTDEAERRTLIRRAYFDTIGLPPSVEELEALLVCTQSQHPWDQAYAALIDRLLASPRFGERWARHWLDLVRYAESRGHEFDYNAPNAFEYRDYVIRALNADLSYDQFVIEQIAGDLLPEPRLHPAAHFNESIIGTGFWFLGEWCHSPVDIRKDECDRMDNMIDVFSKTFLGVTVACARCHDHKFDAISQRDYYALAGYLQSSSYRLTRFDSWQQDREMAARRAALDDAWRPRIAAALAAALRPRVESLAEQLAADLAKAGTDLGVLETDLRGAQVIVDYSRPPGRGDWMTDGFGFGAGPVSAGELLLTGDETAPLEVAAYGAARRDWFWSELSIAPGSENDAGRLAGWLRAGQTLKTPPFTLQSGSVHYLIEGAGRAYAVVDSHAMNNGPLHAELLKETGGNSDLPARWITHDLSRYVGERMHLEFVPKEDEDFRILTVVEGRQRPAAPVTRPNRLIERLAANSPAASAASRTAACRELLHATLSALAENRVASDGEPPDRAAIANWLLAQASAAAGADVSQLAAGYAAEREALRSKIRHAARLCMAMWDGTPVDEQLLIRGNHRTPGPLVPRGLPVAFQGSVVRVQGSGVRQDTRELAGSRLQLARQLVDPRNPLLARVIVNRIWQHLMGRGIVPSVDNFGVLGQQPTHPELLDYLASEFVRDGWSIKGLVRRVMLSSTYRQGSGFRVQGSAQQETEGRGQAPRDNRLSSSFILHPSSVDPENLLFHRQNLKRLEGEALRDAILAVSGRLDAAMYGPSMPVHLTPFMQGRGRPKESGELDGAGRRSIYLAVRRNFLSPLMLAFDTPIPFTTMGRRNVSNVPAQALILMNDPFIAAEAQIWANRVLADGSADSKERIRRMYLAAFSREPTKGETAAAMAFLSQQAREYDQISNPIDGQRAWADLGHVLYNVKEFVIVP